MLCADGYTDMGEGATYQSTWLDVSPPGGDARRSAPGPDEMRRNNVVGIAVVRFVCHNILSPPAQKVWPAPRNLPNLPFFQ